MPVASSPELLAWLAENQFLPPAQIEEIRALLPTFPDKNALIKALFQRNWLTAYQVNQIAVGKGDGLVMGPYRFLERIGEGAMGQVFKAWSVRLGLFVAIKMILREHLASTKAKDRFRREMETASKLDHPNIVLVRDAGESDGRPFIVMDYIDGITLSKLVKTEGLLPIQTACEFARQTAVGLNHAWERGVIHRDIKPGNLMLVRQPTGPGLVKILDFGLARFEIEREEGRLTQIGNLLGTVDYVSPEQAENAHNADIRSDIYSLGCTLFYMLVGKVPFPGASVVEKVTARLLGELPALCAQRTDVPVNLELILHRMMARRPDDRFQTPQEVAAALAPFCSVRPAAGPLMATPVMATPVATPFSPTQPAFPMASPAAETMAPHSLETSPFSFGGQNNPAPVDADNGFADMGGQPQFGGMPNDFAAPAPRATPRQAAEVKESDSFLSKIPAWAWLAGFIGVLMLVGSYFLWSALQPAGPRIAYPNGSMKFVSLPDRKMQQGKNIPIIVTIERKGFNGPVRVVLRKPEGFKSTPKTIGEGQDRTDLMVLPSFGVTGTHELVIEAIAEELRAELRFNVTVHK